MKIFSILSLICLCLQLNAQSFNDFLDYVNGLPSSQRQEKVDSFINNQDQLPYINGTQATFLVQSTAASAALPGDYSGWDPAQSPMIKVTGTNLWYKTLSFDSAARIEYKFYLSGDWVLDSNNPYFAFGGFGANSELRMPDYIAPTETIYRPNIPHGTVIDTSFYSTQLGNNRAVKIYLPPNYAQSTEEYPTVLVHDGLEYVNIAEMVNILDYLIDEGLTEKLIAIFVPPVNRTPEYSGGQQNAFTSFIIDDILNHVDSQYRTIDSPEKRAVMGSSLGGNISMWLGITRDDVFGNIGAFSPYVEPDILQLINFNPAFDAKIYVNHGIYDHLDQIHQSVETCIPMLEAKNYEYLYKEYPEGHSYYFWRAYIDEALQYFFPGTTSTTVSVKPTASADLKISPNPSDGYMNLEITLSESGLLEIQIINQDGHYLQRIKEMINTPEQINKRIEINKENGVKNGFAVIRLNGRVVASEKFIIQH